MADNWYYTQDGKTKIGPLTFAVLQQLAASGVLQPAHMVRQDGGDPRWSQAKTIPGLFLTTPVQPPPAIPIQVVPQTGAPPHQPPVAIPVQPSPESTGSLASNFVLGFSVTDVLQTWGKGWTKFKTWFLARPKAQRWGIVALPFVFIVLCCGGLNGFKGSSGGGGASTIKVQASDMIREYKSNEAAANAKYQGKTVDVSGTIKRITQDFVELEGWGDFELVTVDCHFDRSVLAQFRPGRQVTVGGTCEEATPFAVNIRDCTVIWKQ